MTRTRLDDTSLQRLSFLAALQSGRITVTGNADKPAELLGWIDVGATYFPLLKPHPGS